jgi:hypothetical protein
MIFATSILQAQDISRKWALTYTAAPWLKPVLTSNPANKSLGRGFKSFSVMGEYYLPGKWSVEAGYFRTDVSYGWAGSRTMEGMQLGTKRYLVHPDFFIQPYVAASAQFNWSRHIEESHYVYDDYYRSQYSKNPYISFAPGVGVEIYLLSPIAFVARYNFNIGLDSKTVMDAKPESADAYLLRDRGMYHHLELGVKITFPFRLTGDEEETLLNRIRECYYLIK